MTRYGYFSSRAARDYGYFVYRTPDGREVQVTVISPDPDAAGYVWEDKVCVGVVTDYVRTVETEFSKQQKEFRKQLETNRYEDR